VCFAVNQIHQKSTLPFLQHFTVLADCYRSWRVPLRYLSRPAIIIADTAIMLRSNRVCGSANGASIVVAGDCLDQLNRQNMMFHKNAFALAVVPMVKPPGAVDVRKKATRNSGAPYSLLDGATISATWRCDVLSLSRPWDPRLASTHAVAFHDLNVLTARPSYLPRRSIMNRK